MPTGVIINCLSIVMGGGIGAAAGHKLNSDFKEKLNMIFGVCSMAMGIGSIVLMKNMPAVIFSVVIGSAIGLTIHFEHAITTIGQGMQKLLSKIIPQRKNVCEEEFNQTLLTIIVLFCASGTGIYGSIVSGMYGDHSILIAKSILDFFTALIFACTLGGVVTFIAVPQFLICLLLFFGGSLIYPLTTPDIIDDFKATGGILLVATGFRIIRLKMFPTADMIPAMIIIMPVSWLWASYIFPILN
ncbi:DUF554 domain-containing protein [Clostridium sp. AM58-1XD]|uniref:DUF554 domain-containing protein n=1 Tax=Clostridium sp. AM58-1XD TaxID=2292307 RepID=UPI000E54C8B6|nr:DUF554 domain-containing protein [Clostridium sp. AM58-1XD]RGY98100.1 DUF554 domain-containing protein [Clostridium sp. AM58-1XD]